MITATVMALAVTLAVATYVQATAENGISTRFKIERTGLQPGHVRVRGTLHAPKQACRVGRQAGLYFNRAAHRHLLDTDSSNHFGVVTLQGRWKRVDFPRRLVVIVRRKHVANAFNRYTCLRTRWVWQIHR